MKVLAGVGAGIAFSGTLGSFVSKAKPLQQQGSSIEAGIAYPLSTVFDRPLPVEPLPALF